MLKIKVKQNLKKDTMSCSYKGNKTSTLEHIYAIATLWNNISSNTDMLDKDIQKEIKSLLKEIREEN